MEPAMVQPDTLASRSRRAPRPMPVIVLADVSGSMEGDKIIQLNRSIAGMFDAFGAEDSVRGEIHVAVVAFGGDEAVLHQAMVPASRAVWVDLTPRGRTPMGSAFTRVRELLDDAEAVPERAFPPALVLVSDGMPTDDWEAPLDDLLSSRWGSRALRVAVGIGTDRTAEADEVLRTFSTPGVGVLRTDQIHDINGLFRWVTATVTTTLHERTGQQAVRLEEFD
ncbi:VWA domain-containing protein [Micromonospora sp. NPDC049374]|uniref:vWA domain-containing protein n=1 Tax=Micromonospora sp. NPDC049374 TaxID=3154352 RepID=UPI0034194AA5